MPTSNERSPIPSARILPHILAASILALTIFTLDFYLFPEAAAGTLYVLVILVARSRLAPKFSVFFAAVSTGLILLAIMIFPEPGSGTELVNGAIAAALVWLTALWPFLKLKNPSQEPRFSSLMESKGDAIIRKDVRGIITDWNRGAELLYGYSRGEAVGKHVSLIVPEEKSAELDEIIRSLAEGRGTMELETIRRHRDGRRIPVSLIVSPVFDARGRVMGATSIARDLSRQKQEEVRFRLAVEAAPNAMIMMDREGTIVLVNAQVQSMFGYSREEVMGQKVEMLIPGRFHANHPRLRTGFFDDPQTRFLGAERELYARHKEGREIPVEIGLNPITIDRKLLVLASVIDITQRREAQKRQEKYVADLARSNAELEDFAYVASHDLQEPLRKIRAFSERLESKFSSNLPDEGKDFLRRMSDAAGRMSGLISDLLALSRITSRAKPFERVDLNQIVTDVLEDFDLAIQEAEAKVVLEALPSLEGDAAQMRQLFQNLIGNALKFRRRNIRPQIRIHAESDSKADTVRIFVEDNGIGFEEKHRERIFQVFQRLHTRDEYEGTGIGMAICRKIVLRHGGKIDVRSSVAKGTTFFFDLPQKQPKQEKIHAAR